MLTAASRRRLQGLARVFQQSGAKLCNDEAKQHLGAVATRSPVNSRVVKVGDVIVPHPHCGDVVNVVDIGGSQRNRGERGDGMYWGPSLRLGAAECGVSENYSTKAGDGVRELMARVQATGAGGE